jgi:DNA-binding SARP family transcriptional activator
MNVDIRSDAGFRFGVLGPLEVLRDGRPLSLPAAKQRIVLATLLLRANQHVSPDELIERVWADAVPHNARSALYTHVARLRRALGEDPGGDGSHRLIRTSNDGYVIDLPTGALDLSRFRELVARAGAGQDAAGEADLLGRALGLWRGPVLAGVPSESLHRDEVPLIVEERLRVVDRWFQLGLRLGRDDEMVKVLKEATAEHPFHERLWAQLLVALHRSGRRAEALRPTGASSPSCATSWASTPVRSWSACTPPSWPTTPGPPACSTRATSRRPLSRSTRRTTRRRAWYAPSSCPPTSPPSPDAAASWRPWTPSSTARTRTRRRRS